MDGNFPAKGAEISRARMLGEADEARHVPRLFSQMTDGGVTVPQRLSQGLLGPKGSKGHSDPSPSGEFTPPPHKERVCCEPLGIDFQGLRPIFKPHGTFRKSFSLSR